MQVFLKIGTRFVPVNGIVQVRVEENKITGYFIGVPAAATPAYVAVTAGSDVSMGNFTNGGIFNKTLTA